MMSRAYATAFDVHGKQHAEGSSALCTMPTQTTCLRLETRRSRLVPPGRGMRARRDGVRQAWRDVRGEAPRRHRMPPDGVDRGEQRGTNQGLYAVHESSRLPSEGTLNASRARMPVRCFTNRLCYTLSYIWRLWLDGGAPACSRRVWTGG